MIYYIAPQFLERISKKLASIAKKAKAFGNEFSYTISDHTEMVERVLWEETGYSKTYEVYPVEVKGIVSLDGWEYVGTIDFLDGANVIRSFKEGIPSRFYTSEMVCEHCNTRRQRKNLYIVHNTETDEWKQVGKSCLRSYTGIDPSVIMWFYNFREELNSEAHTNAMHASRYYNVNEIVRIAYESIQKIGYLSQSEVERMIDEDDSYEPEMTTSSITRRIITRDKPLYDVLQSDKGSINKCLSKKQWIKTGYGFEKEDFYKESSKEFVQNCIEYWKGIEPTSDFVRNVQSMLTSGYVEAKHIAILSYLPAGYTKHIAEEERKAKELEAKKEIDYFGSIGQKYSEEIESANEVAFFETVYGVMKIYSIITKSGAVLTWKTTSSVPYGKTKISFKVKAHDLYKGYKQTVIERPRFA